MIVGITGVLCAGKSTLVEYLVKAYGFEAVNILEMFRHRLRARLLELKKIIEA